jgi:transposase-like protein
MPSKKPTTTPLPTTLAGAIRYFADQDVAHAFVTKLRFPNGVACPRQGCGSANVGFITTRRMWQCKDCKKQSSVKVGTIFEDSPIGFDKWLPAMWMLAGDRNGISSCELARAIGVTQKTAWFMLHRIRLAMKHKTLAPPLSGEIEADETFVGGRTRATRRTASGEMKLAHGPATGKTTVFGMLERGNPSQVRAMVVPEPRPRILPCLDRPHGNVRRRQRDHEPDRKLLGLPQAHDPREVHRAAPVPSRSVRRRASVPLQQPRVAGRRPPGSRVRGHGWPPDHLRAIDHR